MPPPFLLFNEFEISALAIRLVNNFEAFLYHPALLHSSHDPGKGHMQFKQIKSLRLFLTLVGLPLIAHAQSTDRAVFSHTSHSYELHNHVLGIRWTITDGHIEDWRLEDFLHHKTLPASEPFSIAMADGRVLRSSDLKLVDEALEAKPLVLESNSPSQARHTPGLELSLPLESPDHALTATLRVILLDDTAYERAELTLHAEQADQPIRRIELVHQSLSNPPSSPNTQPAPEASVSGTVPGSPIVTPTLFLGLEHPISQSRVTHGLATAWVERELPLRFGQSVSYSSVFGVVHSGQLRRDFLAYLERERAHPYRTFLHYNSWYDLGYFTPYTADDAVDRIQTFGHELVEERGVKLDSFLFDDGWDDHHSLWKFNSGFPQGFTPVTQAAQKIGAAPGIWMSPWGGYSTPRKERIEFGTQAGYEIVRNGYALSGLKYYQAFRDVALDMIRTYHVNQFKFDGTGNVDTVVPGSQFDSDFAAAIHLIGELRQADPGLFINLTTGTWPSPFWLRYSDTIWRGGEDDSFAGVGSYRQRWITYRDSDTYRRIVQAGPLYPLNSLMLHGMIYARFHKHLNVDPGSDFRDEIRSYFGTGTQLQEMYITPALLTKQNWDDLAEAAKWSRENAEVLRDVHWIGGDPIWLEVYGWVSWAPRKGIITLRNPSDHAQTIRVKLADAFELPAGAARRFTANSPWRGGDQKRSLISADKPHEFSLRPFEVLTLEFSPRK